MELINFENVGIQVFGYCIAEFSAIFTHNLKQKTAFQEAQYGLQKFMKDNRMSLDIRKRIMKFFHVQWYYNGGVEIISKMSLFHNATYKIQQDVLIKERMETIMNIPLFAESDLDFVQLVATSSKVLLLPPNEIVTYADGVNIDLYIIQKGYCLRHFGK